jgi:crossover junction endodeoxyribonuclease RuvC
MIILGIDPGIGRVGYGIIEKIGSKLKAVTYGCIETPKTDDHGLRLQMIKNDLGKIIREHKPEVIGIEKLFFQKNVKTAGVVGEARGVILLLASESGARVIEVGPGQVKQALTGYGNADKKQMQQMVKIIFKLEKIPKPDDAADALAVAYAAAVLTPSPKNGRG